MYTIILYWTEKLFTEHEIFLIYQMHEIQHFFVISTNSLNKTN